MFSICLGKNGGYMQLGGYDSYGALQNTTNWVSLLPSGYFKINLFGIKMNNVTMNNTQVYSVGLLDSGTTFTYMPSSLLKIIRMYFI
jgi:hypothetical protein